MRRGVVLLATAAVLVSACGSGDDASSSGASDASATTAAVAGASENAVVSGAVCYEWPSGTIAMPCAVGLKGPGGGRVFYDAGSEQPWGRFLEVAPQNWGGTLYDCGSCGAVPPVTKKTSDKGSGSGYYPCIDDEFALLLPGEAGDTLWEIGGGRHNTEVLSKTPECVDGSVSAVTLAAGYRGGGLSDWYLPSGGELTELCKYTGRSAIGGFTADAYVSSTVGMKVGTVTGGVRKEVTNFFMVNFAGNPLCQRTDSAYVSGTSMFHYPRPVRPIRAFSVPDVTVGSVNWTSGQLN
jgi:hypothetical protein